MTPRSRARRSGSRDRGVIALVSGGLDSLLLVERLLQDRTVVFPLYVRCGFVWESAELSWLGRWLPEIQHRRLRPLTIMAVPLQSVYANHWSVRGKGVPSRTSPDSAVYLPGRNLVLLGVAALRAVRCGLSRLAIGLLAGNPFGDATPRFLRRFATCLTQALSHTMQIETPLRRWAKPKLIVSAQTEPLELTFSCLQPQGHQHCGRCQKCGERQRAFRQARVLDPTRYVT